MTLANFRDKNTPHTGNQTVRVVSTGSNANQYAGGKFHYLGYGGEYGDLKNEDLGFAANSRQWLSITGRRIPESGRRSCLPPIRNPVYPHGRSTGLQYGHPASEFGSDMVSEFHRRTSSGLQKFAFVTNGAFTASATVKIREGEGVTGTVLYRNLDRHRKQHQ